MEYSRALQDAHSQGKEGGAPDERRLRVFALGRFEVRSGARCALDDSWSRTKAKAIVKLLAVAGRPLHRDEVIEALWPESSAGASQNSLRQSLHQLRVAFADRGLPAPVVSDRESLFIHPDAWTDIGAFRNAAVAARSSRTDAALYEKAIDLYGGDLLPHDTYEDWAEPARSDLKSMHLRLLSDLADLCRNEGRCETAEELLLRVLQADPLREPEHRTLMRVYMHCGRRGEAARQYQVCRDVLKRELGVDPSEETEALYREVVDGHPEAGAAPLAGGSPANGRPGGPQIRYATTRDGVRIAYSTLGQGPPLVMTPTSPMSHLRMEWDIPEWRRFFERIAENRTVVRYDARGTGMSPAEGAEYSLATLALDLEAVVGDLELDAFDLYASFNCGPLAITYAADHAERVSRLILLSCYASGREFMAPSQVQAVAGLMGTDWNMYSQTMANALAGWSGGDFALRFAAFVRDSVRPENAAAFFNGAVVDADASPRLGQVTAPTLVLHRRGVDWLKVEVARRLAVGIPGARLVLLDGTSALPFIEDTEAVAAAIEKFLCEAPPGDRGAAEALLGAAARPAPSPATAPPVHFATAADGVSIAYWTLGDGPPLIVMPRLPFSHVEHEWEIREWREWYERLAASHTVIRYDARGAGRSQREVEQYSLDSLALDVDAVADALGLDRFDLFGFGHSSPVAVRYAAERPERVGRLVLWCPYATGREFWRSSRTRAFQALRRRDWVLYTDTSARVLYAWEEGDAPRRLAAMMRESMDEEMAETAFAAMRRFDVRRFLSGVKAATLVMVRDGVPEPEVAQSRRVASQIAGAQLCVLEGPAAVPFLGDAAACVRAIDEFLSGVEQTGTNHRQLWAERS